MVFMFMQLTPGVGKKVAKFIKTCKINIYLTKNDHIYTAYLFDGVHVYATDSRSGEELTDIFIVPYMDTHFCPYPSHIQDVLENANKFLVFEHACEGPGENVNLSPKRRNR
jgi:hypothetical protein